MITVMTPPLGINMAPLRERGSASLAKVKIAWCKAYALHMHQVRQMRTVSIFKNGKNQAIRLPVDMTYEGVGELEICRKGDVITLRPVRPSWASFAELPVADADFLQDRPAVIGDEARLEL